MILSGAQAGAPGVARAAEKLLFRRVSLRKPEKSFFLTKSMTVCRGYGVKIER
jgi:hypothetical protein